MSRIGKQPIKIEEGVSVEVKSDIVFVKSPKGGLNFKLPPGIKAKVKNSDLIVEMLNKTKKTPGFWGLTRSILFNMVKGVKEGFSKKLIIEGVGFKAALEGEKRLKLDMGFSHPVFIAIPEDLEVQVAKNEITISGIDKQKVGELAAKIRKVRPPEPYKGKGIRYSDEVVRRKEGKKAGAV